MRAVTWNVQHGRPNPDGSPDVGPVLAALRTLEADVVALQELDRGRRRSGRVDQPELLARGLGMELVWEPTVRLGGEYGIALLVAGVVRRAEVARLPGHGEPRAAAIVEAEVAGERWTVACTHLSTHRPTAARQLVAVFDALRGWPAPRVLLGDLNLIGAEVLPWSTAEGYQLVDGAPTHSTRRRRVTRRIDHVLLAGAHADRAQVLDLGTSDHKAVVVDLAARPRR